VLEGRERHPLLCLQRSDSGGGTAFLFRWWYWDGCMSAHGLLLAGLVVSDLILLCCFLSSKLA